MKEHHLLKSSFAEKDVDSLDRRNICILVAYEESPCRVVSRVDYGECTW